MFVDRIFRWTLSLCYKFSTRLASRTALDVSVVPVKEGTKRISVKIDRGVPLLTDVQNNIFPITDDADIHECIVHHRGLNNLKHPKLPIFKNTLTNTWQIEARVKKHSPKWFSNQTQIMPKAS